MHEALRHAVSEVKSYFPYDTISATQVGFDRVQIIMPEAALDDLVHMLHNSEDTPGLRDEVSAADARIADLQSEVSSLRRDLCEANGRIYDLDVEADKIASNAAEDEVIADETIASLTQQVESLTRSLASARRQMDYWMDELESNDIEVRPPRV